MRTGLVGHLMARDLNSGVRRLCPCRRTIVDWEEEFGVAISTPGEDAYAGMHSARVIGQRLTVRYGSTSVLVDGCRSADVWMEVARD